MSRKARIWLGSTVGYLAYLSVARFVPGWLSLPSLRGWILFGALALIGLAGWLFTSMFLTRRQPPPPPPQDPLSQEMEAALALAHKRLVDARVARGRVLQRLPAVFVLGPRQNHKTSSVLRSGAQAELLAGDVLRGAQVVPTQTVNAWYAGSSLFVEAGVDVVGSEERFTRLLRHFQPARLADAIARGEQAPRAVLLCYSCDNLRRAGARDAVLADAREWRGTLGAIARAYGIRLPVYVLFTKADALPGFKEYVKRLGAEEARGVLGATMPLDPEAAGTRYADRATAQVRGELYALFESLAARRLDLLALEEVQGDRPRAYQFPREVRKLEPLISDFLVELGRPSDLATSAFVRGFYFSGVREVVVGDGAPFLAPVAPGPASAPEEGGATALLSALPRNHPAAAQAARGGEAAGRREAQWVFLDRLISQVLLSDASALGVTRGGTRISLFRRAALVVAAGLAAAFSVILFTSFLANRRLQRDARHHIAAVAALPAPASATPANAELLTLDSLGAVLDALSEFEHGLLTSIRPRWGLFQGGRLYDAVHGAYFARFAPMLLDSLQPRVATRLAALPTRTAMSAGQFDTSYARLWGYLITTAVPDSSPGDSLAAVLMSDWYAPGRADSTGQALALRQFRRYARELRLRNPYQRAPDEAAVAHARQVLHESAGEQFIYQAIIQSVSRAVPGYSYGEGGGALAVTGAVRGAFTRVGRDSVGLAIQNVDRYISGDNWVLGPPPPDRPPPNRTDLRISLRNRYEAEYVDEWRRFVRSASVTRYASLDDAAQKLTLLASASGLLRFFGAVNENLTPDTTGPGRPFTPIRQLASPAGAESRVGAALGGYVQQLNALAERVRSAAGATGEGAVEQLVGARAAIAPARGAKIGVDLALGAALAGPLDLPRLLQQPIDRAGAILDERIDVARRAVANPPPPPGVEPGKAFCDEFAPLASKAPFNSAVALTPDAALVTPAEIAQYFARGSGTIWTLPRQTQNALVQRGDAFVAGEPPAPAPTDSALAFANALARITATLFPAGASDARLEWSMAPVVAGRDRRIAIVYGARPRVAFDARASAASLPGVTWRLGADDGISILRERNQRDDWNPVATFPGPWAPLFLFRSGRQTGTGPNGEYLFEIPGTDGTPVRFRAQITRSSFQVVLGDIFQSVPRCPGRWVRRPR
jgi:type VI secretion system protein ImpL